MTEEEPTNNPISFYEDSLLEKVVWETVIWFIYIIFILMFLFALALFKGFIHEVHLDTPVHCLLCLGPPLNN